MAGEIVESEDVREQITDYLVNEFEDLVSSDERAEYEERLSLIRKQREGEPENQVKNSPWDDASNVSLPLAMSKTQVGFASLKSAVTQHDPLWEARVVEGVEGLHDHAKALTRFLKVLADGKDFLNMREVHNKVLYQTASEGTCVVKVPWVRQVKQYKRRAAHGGLESVGRLQRVGPQVIPIRQDDYLQRAIWMSPDRAPWVGHRFRLPTHELMNLRSQGVYDQPMVDAVMGMTPKEPDEALLEAADRAGISLTNNLPVMSQMHEFVEFHFYWDVDEDGITEDLIFTIHPESGLIMREDLNEVGRRIFEPFRYVPRPDVFHAMGVGHIMTRLQAAGDSIFNLTMDTAVMNLIKMYVARRGSSMEYDEQVEPGKVFLADESTDIREMETAPMDPSGFTLLGLMKQYGDMGSGFSDNAQGLADQVLRTRDTFRGSMFRDQKGSEVFFQTIADDIAQSYGNVGELVLLQLVRHRDETKEMLKMLSEEDQRKVSEILDMDPMEIPRTFKMKVTVTELDRTEESRRQSLLTATQLYAQYAERMGFVVQMLSSPQIQRMPKMVDYLVSVYIGGTELMRETFKDFGIDDPSNFLPSVEQELQLKEALNNMQQGAVSDLRVQTGRAIDGRGALQAGQLASSSGVGSVPAGGSESGAGTPAQ